MSGRQPVRFVADLPMLAARLPGERKQAWIYRQIADAVDLGNLRPGDSVPSTRALAQRWRVSRGVVEAAFEQLGVEGYLVAAVGRGTWVSDSPPMAFQRASSTNAAPAVAATGVAAAGEGSKVEVLRAEAARLDASPTHPVRGGHPFIARLPDVAGVDLASWRACIVQATRTLTSEHLGDADPRGLLALREAVCRHLAVSRGLRCDPSAVMIVTGIRHAIDLCALALDPASAPVALEDPGYPGARAIFRWHGRRMVDIGLDDAGIDLTSLERSGAGLVYVTPAHQAPTGLAMSSQRRTALLAWAEAAGAWVLEDDYDSDFNYEQAPWPALKAADTADRVIYCGSFNKSLFPGLRIGYLVAPRALMPRLLAVRAATGRSNAVIDQLALTRFLQSGAMLRHLKRARLAYKTRRDLVVDVLRAAGWPLTDLQGLQAGFHFVLRLPAGTDERDCVARLAHAGITVQTLRDFWSGNTPPPVPALVIGYAALTRAQAKWSARTLAALL
jgi:GntR family transcriptional regulator/MocR family aminotransferase